MSVSRSSNFLYFLYFFCKSKIHCGLWKAAKSAHKVSKFQQQLIFGTVEYLSAAVVWAHQEKPLIYFAATELSVHNCVCFFPFFSFLCLSPWATHTTSWLRFTPPTTRPSCAAWSTNTARPSHETTTQAWSNSASPLSTRRISRG